MEIEKVKKIGQGYLINGTTTVPNDENNRHYKMVQEWIKDGGVVEEESLDESLARVKENKKQEIKKAFEIEVNRPIKVNNITWNGGYETILKFDSVKRLAEIVDEVEVIFYDINNEEYTLTIAEATNIILTLDTKYQQYFTKKQSLLNQIDNITSMKDVEVIEW